MNSLKSIRLFAIAAAAAGFVALEARGQGTPPPAAVGAGPVVPARIKVGEKTVEAFKDVDLVDFKGDDLFYRDRGGPAGIAVSIKADTVTEAEFRLKYEEEPVYKAMMTRNWAGAAAVLLPVVTPVLPYLALKDNDVIEPTVDAGSCVMKAAAALARTRSPNPEKVKAAYMHAYAIFKALTRAEWHPAAEPAKLKGVLCLIAVGDLGNAENELDQARTPEPGDGAYGLYWLAQARLRLAKKQSPRFCTDAVIKSIVFETKDIDTFPEALLVSGRCYEDLLEFHRARDVYYEVVKLFANTEWEDIGRERLQFIMDKGLTKAKEEAPIENIFFGLVEDMNAKADALLKGEDETQKIVIEDKSDDELIRADARERDEKEKEKQKEKEEQQRQMGSAEPPAAPPDDMKGAQ